MNSGLITSIEEWDGDFPYIVLDEVYDSTQFFRWLDSKKITSLPTGNTSLLDLVIAAATDDEMEERRS